MIGPIMGGMKFADYDASKYAMTFAGNSIADPAYGSDLVPQLNAMAPVSNKFSITTRAHAGYGFTQLESVANEVDVSFVNGRINFLIIFELTNTIYNDGKTGLETCAQLAQYIANRKALHPWRVVVMTGLPRGSLFGGTWDVTTGEQQMKICNAYLRENYRAMGAIACVEARRAGGPFDFTDASNGSNFPAALWDDRTHPNHAGRTYLAQYIADVLKRLPAR